MPVKFFDKKGPGAGLAGPEYAASNGSVKRTAIVVEKDPVLRERVRQVLHLPASTPSVAQLSDLDAAELRAVYPLALVLGPSQAHEQALAKVAELLRARPSTGAVLLVTQSSAKLMRSALRAGVADAIELANLDQQLPQAVVELLQRLESELAAAAEAERLAQLNHPQKGWVTTVFSPKGGVGKSVVSVNLAAALAKHTGKATVILDLDLQFGDVAVMLRLQPSYTLTDAVSAGELLDRDLLKTFLVRHEKSNVFVLSAPVSPSEADQVDQSGMLRVLSLLQEMFEHVIVDSPPHLSDVVLQAVAESDSVAFVVALDVPSVKNARLGLQAFDLLQFPPEKVMLIVNRADSKVLLGVSDVEKALKKKVDFMLPSEAVVPRAVNQGVPALLEYPRSRFAGQIDQLATALLTRSRTSPTLARGQ